MPEILQQSTSVPETTSNTDAGSKSIKGSSLWMAVAHTPAAGAGMVAATMSISAVKTKSATLSDRDSDS